MYPGASYPPDITAKLLARAPSPQGSEVPKWEDRERSGGREWSCRKQKEGGGGLGLAYNTPETPWAQTSFCSVPWSRASLAGISVRAGGELALKRKLFDAS